MSILSISNLCVRYIGSHSLAANHVSFSIGKGEIFALVGESGSGWGAGFNVVQRGAVG